MGKKLTNEEFLNKLQEKNIKYKPLDEYINSQTKIRWQCDKYENHIWSAIPNNILNGHGCPYCTNEKILVGYNDMWTTNPNIASMLLNHDDGYKYQQYSNKKTDWICPTCNRVIRNKIINTVTTKGKPSCKLCNDGISYPEKFISELLNQLNVSFLHEIKFNWSNGKRYDFYIEDMSLIIECHGMQHYNGKFNSYGMKARSLEEEIINDDFKHNIAINNGIKHYIQLDCRYSNVDYIKQSVLNSELNNLFNLSCIDWDLCNKKSLLYNTIEVCNLWNSGFKYVGEIANKLNLDISTVIYKLKSCADAGLCDYKPHSSYGAKKYKI